MVSATPSPRPGGFSLIELMVTLAVVAVLAAAALPFAQSWRDSNRQLQMRSQLMSGIAQARALALRNPNGFTSTDSTPVEVARLSYDSGSRILRLTSKNADGSWPASNTTPLWQSTAPSGDLSLRLVGTGDNFTCVAYDSRGRPLNSGTCALPADTRQVAVNVSSQGAINVDLL